MRASQIDATQKGITMKKMDRQPNQSTSSPPTDGPTAGARITPTVNSEMARPCSCG